MSTSSNARLQRTDLAEASYIWALQRAPQSALARFQLGLLQLRSARPAAAFATWAPLETLGDGHPLLLFKRGFEALALDRFPEARRWLLAGIGANASDESLNREVRMVLDRMTDLGALAGREPPQWSAPPQSVFSRIQATQRPLSTRYTWFTSLGSATAPELPPHPPELLAETRARDGQPRYCTYPFRLYGVSSSTLVPCSWVRRIDGESVILPAPGLTPDLPRIWRGRAFDNVRRAVARGDYVYCNLEHCPELKGFQDYFLTMSELRDRYPLISRFVTGEVNTYEGGPEIVNMQYDPTCNLACPSCNRLRSAKPDSATLSAYGNAICELGADLKQIYLAGMGDPFGSPHYHEWLCTLELERFPQLREISLSTNALRWTEQTWRRIPERTRRLIRSVVVSLDGVSPETIEKNRYPAPFADQLDRLRYVASLRRAREFDKLRIYFVYQENNFHEMPDMVALCRELGIDSVFFARLSNWNSWPPERFAPLDVGSASHPRHKEFLSVAAETERLGDDRLEVIMMRP